MYFEKDHLYHIYNRSNNKTFVERDNYLFFLKKIQQHIKPNCEILAWCLMPNHFYFLIQATNQSVALINEKHRSQTQQLSKSWGVVLSSYTQAYNKKYNQKGSLWAHNTNASEINDGTNYYSMVCFQYIHQNPLISGLAEKMEDWEFSSYRDYLNQRNGRLVNKNLAYNILNYDQENFKKQSETILLENDLKYIR